MTQTNPYHQESLSIDPKEQIHKFRQALRHNNPEDAVKPFTQFIRHYQVCGVFHQFTKTAIKFWLNGHRIRGDVLSGVEIAINNWWTGSRYYISGSNSHDCVTYALIAGILTIKKDSCIYPGAYFPIPDEILANYLTQAWGKVGTHGSPPHHWTPTINQKSAHKTKDPSDWNEGISPREIHSNRLNRLVAGPR